MKGTPLCGQDKIKGIIPFIAALIPVWINIGLI